MTAFEITHRDAIEDLVARGALFVVNHSAGKDSQAMFIELDKLVPREQMVVIHADLGDVEWEGNLEHIRATVGNVPILVTRSRRGLLQMVEERGMWPSPQQRQCTSDLKRGPIEREIRRYLKENPRYNGLVVNCMGMRAQESTSRAKLRTFRLNERNSKAGREWHDYLPIHHMSLDEVNGCIAGAGQKPHWAYSLGMTRLSCVFCIMASRHDLMISARHNPEKYARHVALEKKIGHTLSMTGQGLEEITGIKAH